MSHHHDDVPLRALGWCLTLQMIGLVVEFIGGHLTHSLAVTSDGWHMAADVLPALVTLIVRAVIQTGRHDRDDSHFHAGVNGAGLFNALTLVAAGGLAIAGASPAVSVVNRHVHFWPALLAALIGLGCNLGGHRLLHRFSHQSCSHDSRLDIASLSSHLLIDTIGSLVASLFLILNAVYNVSWWDTAGGVIIGGWMVVYGLYLAIKVLVRSQAR